MGRRPQIFYICQSCGYQSPKWLGRCIECGAWNAFIEEAADDGRSAQAADMPSCRPVPLADVPGGPDGHRINTGIKEFDRVLGGGMVPGATVLLGGEPGIGKSTLLLQVLAKAAASGKKVLYISGEEAPTQIRTRAIRLGMETTLNRDFLVAGEVYLERMERYINDLSPDILAVDSIQTTVCADITSTPGSISQVREAASRLIQISRPKAMTMFLVGHVTKEGTLAGPRILEHLVDTVLYFEGERGHVFRILRTVKNRYGPTYEIGVFEMAGNGLREVDNPSEVFLTDRPEAVPGSVVTVCLEGTRPILVEIQALVSRSYLANPRRTSTGFDANRLAMLIAVAERQLGVVLYDKDIFINVAGGLRITEPAADIAILMAIISSLHGTPIHLATALFGEIGLTGEIRSVARAGLRLNEIARLGFKKCIMPVTKERSDNFHDFNIVFARDVKECAECLGI